MRLDKWLWAARFFKTRALAAEAIDGGKVDVNGDRAKRAKPLQVGDEVRLRQGPMEWVLRVRDVAGRRGSAEIARAL
ncbi:MAG: RNA-binding S4 domain-containing protein, partial [Gemmatimonas sp.]